jgi:hypothetical protein
MVSSCTYVAVVVASPYETTGQEDASPKFEGRGMLQSKLFIIHEATLLMNTPDLSRPTILVPGSRNRRQHSNSGRSKLTYLSFFPL